MRKIVVLIPLLALFAFGCSFYETIAGSGDLVEIQTSYSGFSVLDVNAPFDVTVIHDTQYGATFMVDDNILDHVQVVKSGQTLSIGLDPFYGYNNVTLKAVITVPYLEGLKLSNASVVTVINSASMPSVPTFGIEVNDASHLLLGSIVADSVSIRIDGAGRATIGVQAGVVTATVDDAGSLQMNGSAYDLSLTVSDASAADLKDFQVYDAYVTLSGASEAWIRVDGSLRPEITGASTLYYRGSVALISPIIADASSIIQY